MTVGQYRYRLCLAQDSCPDLEICDCKRVVRELLQDMYRHVMEDKFYRYSGVVCRNGRYRPCGLRFRKLRHYPKTSQIEYRLKMISQKY